jgi:hypothetical protein
MVRVTVEALVEWVSKTSMVWVMVRVTGVLAGHCDGFGTAEVVELWRGIRGGLKGGNVYRPYAIARRMSLFISVKKCKICILLGLAD